MTTPEEIEQLKLALRIKRAELAGEPLEWEVHDGLWSPPHPQGPCEPMAFIVHGTPIRIKPFVLGRTVNGFTLGEGQEWHRQDFTRDMLPKGWRPLLLGEGHEPKDEWKREIGWVSCIRSCPSPINGGNTHYRTCRPLPPFKWVPLVGDDIPAGSEFQKNGIRYQWLNLQTQCITLFSTKYIVLDFTEMMRENYQIKRPGEDWAPCKKLKQ